MDRSRPKLIAFTGRSGSGKTTISKYLKYTHGFEIISIAEPLKKIGLAMEFSEREMFGSQGDKLKINSLWNITGREFLTKFGTEICRSELPKHIPEMNEVWLRILDRRLYNLLSIGKLVCVDDLRFKDEAHIIRKHGGIIIKMTPSIGSALDLNTKKIKHSSESQHIKCDHTIINDGGNTMFSVMDILYPSENYWAVFVNRHYPKLIKVVAPLVLLIVLIIYDII